MATTVRSISLISGLTLITGSLVASASIAGASPAKVLYAAPTAAGNQTCSSWANACTLSQAVTSADNGDTVELKGGTYSDTGDTVAHSITIEAGPQQDVTVDGPASAEAFTITAGGSSLTTLRDFTISGGGTSIHADGTAPVMIDRIHFAASTTPVVASGPTTVDESTLDAGNVGTEGVVAGAGGSGTVTVENSYLDGYEADVSVSGISQSVDITNSTLTTGDYGVLDAQNAGSLSITSSTIALDTSDGILVTHSGFALTFGADIVADNAASCSFGPELSTDDGYNISDDATCGFSASSSISSSNSLDENIPDAANNGGPTDTLKILTGPSVGLVTGPVGGHAVCGTADQRGFPRPKSACDAGAFQSGAPTPVAKVTVKASPASSHPGKKVTLTATVHGNWSAPDGGYVTFLDGAKSVNSTSCTYAPLSASGVATCPATTLPAGADKVSAYFYGDGIYPPTSSPAATVRITDLTTTSISAAAHGSVGTKISVKATTKRTGTAKLSGTITFKDNGKKVATVKEKSTGKVSTKIKLVRGKNVITATYSGNSTCAKSAGKKTITGK